MLEGGKKRATGKDVIAIVYVDGAILPGKPDPGPFGRESSRLCYSTPIRKALDKIAKTRT